MFVVNDLARLKEYGFEPTGKINCNGWAEYQKPLDEVSGDYPVKNLRLIVNSYYGAHENEIIIYCELDASSPMPKESLATWPLVVEEARQLVRDGVADFVKRTP